MIVVLILILFITTYFAYSNYKWAISENKRVIQLESEKNNLQSQINSLNSQIQQVQNKLQSTEKNLEATKDELTEKKAEIKILQDKVSTYESQLSDLNIGLQQAQQGLTTCINDVYYTQSYDFVMSHETGFKLVCAKPCSLNQEKLDEIYFQMAHAMIDFEKNLKVDIFKFFKSIEVHAEPDKVCNKEVPACAYASILGQTPELRRGFICNIVKGCESSLEVYLHELAHMIWKNHDVPISFNEGFSEVISAIISGNQKSFCDKEFHIESSTLFGLIKKKKTVTPYTKGEELFYQLCKKYGFDFEHLPLFFQKASKYPNYYSSGLVFNDFVNIISSIVDEDVSQTVNEVMSIPIEGTECGNNKCENDERFNCVSDCS